MSVKLLDKTRKINKLLHNNNSHKVVFNDLCNVMGELLRSNISVLSNKGKVLGIYSHEGIEPIHEMLKEDLGEHIDSELNERFLSVLSTKENVSLLTLGFDSNEASDYNAIILPVDIAGERLGTVFMYRVGIQYSIDDIIIGEYGTTVVALEMMRSVYEENAENSRKETFVKSALSSLSVTELAATKYILNELKCMEGLVVASKIADKYSITRSIIVNAIKKLESAGIIEAHSSGMKGTYIKIVNDVIYKEVDKYSMLIKYT